MAHLRAGGGGGCEEFPSDGTEVGRHWRQFAAPSIAFRVSSKFTRLIRTGARALGASITAQRNATHRIASESVGRRSALSASFRPLFRPLFGPLSNAAGWLPASDHCKSMRAHDARHHSDEHPAMGAMIKFIFGRHFCCLRAAILAESERAEEK